MQSKKRVHVDLGKKGGFTIKHPGAFRRAAQKAGKSTRNSRRGDSGQLGRRARSAMGLMAMRKRGSSS